MEHLSSARWQGAIDETAVHHTYAAGISWAAVLGGAFVTAALSLMLLALGTGLGFASVSPWANTGASATTVGVAAVGWLILMQVISSSMGGYLAGRFRTKWTAIHTDEVYFRDTAHGFLAWSVAFVATAAFLATAATAMVGAAATGGAAATAQSDTRVGDANGYFVDSLFRSNGPRADATAASVRTEAGLVFAHSLAQKELVPADRAYLGQLVAQRTGLSQSEADKRVSDVFQATQQAADLARKATAHTLLWVFLALLIGAFCASVSATIGGRQRDQVVRTEYSTAIPAPAGARLATP